MPTTDYGYYYPDASTSLTPLAAVLAAMAASSDAAYKKTPAVFDTIAARDAAIPTPTEGRVVYTKDYDILWHYAGGWQPVGVPTFTNVTARDAAITSPVAGMKCVVGSGATMVEYVHNGSAWTLSRPFSVRKGSSQTVTSNTTLTDDSDLRVTLPVGTYLIEAALIASGPAAGDIKLAWTFSGAGSTYRTCMGPSVSTASVTDGPMRSASNSLGLGVSYGCDGSASSAIRETLIAVVTSPGLLKLQFAQNTSTASATGLASGSALVVIPL